MPEIVLSECRHSSVSDAGEVDAAYHTLFRCNVKMIRHDYPHMHRYLQRLNWGEKAFRDYTNFSHIKKGYAGVGKGNRAERTGASHPAIGCLTDPIPNNPS